MILLLRRDLVEEINRVFTQIKHYSQLHYTISYRHHSQRNMNMRLKESRRKTRVLSERLMKSIFDDERVEEVRTLTRQYAEFFLIIYERGILVVIKGG